MLMLTGYFDETGHADDPVLNFAGMAGFVAPLGRWLNFTDQWTDTLKNAGLSEPFHMKDFAHSTGQFKTWKGREDNRRLLFGRLVEIIRETKATPIGAAVSLRAFENLTPVQQTEFRDPYYLCFQTCTRGAAIEAVFESPSEKVSMVYAFNEEYGTANRQNGAEALWHVMKKYVTLDCDLGSRMGSYATGTPREVPPLQAADLFAYELCHEFENRIKRPTDSMRWGLRQILRMCQTSPRIILFDRKELLRRILESGWPDQTGVEEVSNDQMRSAQEAMMSWYIKRVP
jgi:hypothetical protein